MKIILKNKILNLGKIGDKVHVKSGYARNFLIPQGKAVVASYENIKLFEENKKILEKEISKKIYEAKKIAEKIKILKNITIYKKVGNKNKLFGSIGKKDISEEIAKQINIKISKNTIYLPNGIIKKLGIHKIYLNFFNKISEKLLVHIEKK